MNETPGMMGTKRSSATTMRIAAGSITPSIRAAAREGSHLLCMESCGLIVCTMAS